MPIANTFEQSQLRTLAARFVENEVSPYATEWDRVEAIDRGIIAKLGELGFLGLTIPETDGGSGGTFRDYVLVLEELGRGDSSVRGLVSVSLGLVAKAIFQYGDIAQRTRWLSSLCNGKSLGCFALTEPNTGSDAANLISNARPDEAGWILNGNKIFITNGTWADIALVFARTGEPGPKGISCFAVPTSTPGFEATPIKGKLGLRGQPTAMLTFTDVFLPADSLIGKEGQGFSIAMSTLAKGRVSVAAGCVGIARAALEVATKYAVERHQFGKPIAAHQLIQEILADISVETDAARLLVQSAADVIDAGERVDIIASKAKYFASEVAVRATNNALQVFGGYGYIDEYPISKLVRDARVMTLYEGTSQLQKLIIGRDLTGIGAF